MPLRAENRTAIDRWILTHTPEKGRLLDIGCGDGDLLARMVKERGVRGMGIELSEQRAGRAFQKGLSVHHGDAEEGMGHYADGVFDLVVISLTIQEVDNPRELVSQALRVGGRVIVVFPNFGHWRVRWQLVARGRAPVTSSFPAAWFESPNRHFFTIADWEVLCRRENWRVVERAYLMNGLRIGLLPNLRAEVAMYMLGKA